MILYHTGRTEIRDPDIHHGRTNADFGPGFYLTPDRDFACRWARSGAVINIYELDTEGLDIRRFGRDSEWFSYICSNRYGKDTVSADIVIGPIANDTIYDTLGMLTSGMLPEEVSLKVLMLGPEYTQLAVKTERAASRLKWIGSETGVDTAEYAALIKEEQDDFLRGFNRILDETAESGK